MILQFTTIQGVTKNHNCSVSPKQKETLEIIVQTTKMFKTSFYTRVSNVWNNYVKLRNLYLPMLTYNIVHAIFWLHILHNSSYMAFKKFNTEFESSSAPRYVIVHNDVTYPHTKFD